MPKKVYIGVDGMARNVKKIHVGVHGVARSVKKGYIGIGGVARPFFGGEGLVYYGEITPLRDQKHLCDSARVGDYALIAGGQYYNYDSSETLSPISVDAYNKSLTRINADDLSIGRSCIGTTSAISQSGKAMFAGGQSNTYEYHNIIDAYDKYLTRTLPASLSVARSYIGAGTIGEYALFGGGQIYSTSDGRTNYSTVDAYNSSFTRTVRELSVAKYDVEVANVGNYALFAGGYDTARNVNVDAFDSSLTRKVAPQLSNGIFGEKGASIGEHVIFPGYFASSNGNITAGPCEAYDSSLTRTSLSSLSNGRYSMAITTLENYAIFAGGYYQPGSTRKTVDVFDKSLTLTTIQDMNYNRGSATAVTIGNYALIAGGSGGSNYLNIVEAYTIL